MPKEVQEAIDSAILALDLFEDEVWESLSYEYEELGNDA